MTELERLLHDTDIQWMGTDVGLHPVIAGGVLGRLNALGAHHIAEMIDLVSLENLFVAAHVILTRISGVEYEATPTWNGLMIDIMLDGSVGIDSAQRYQLSRLWRRWLETVPHPDRLPAEADRLTQNDAKCK